LYGSMHRMREQMISTTLASLSRPLLVLRPTLLFGPDDTHNAYGPNRFIRMAQERARIELFGEGEEQRDHVWIGDVCRLIHTALEHESIGILNVATGVSTSFLTLARCVADQLGPDVAIVTHARRGPITHRHFDITNQIKAFPEFHYTPLDQ